MKIDKSLQSAHQYYQAGDLNQASNICKKILKVKPNNIDALHFLEMICCQLGNFDDAIRYIRKELELIPSNADVNYKLGTVLQAKGLFSEAIDYFRKAITLKPHFPEACYHLGVVLQKKGQLDEAVINYQKALQINPDLAEVQNNLGNVLREKGQLDEAIGSYQKAIKLNPNFDLAYYNLGVVLREKGQLDEAIGSYQKAIKLNPNFYIAYNNLGGVLIERGQLNEAEIYFRRVLQITPDNCKFYSNLLFNMNYNSRYNPQDIFSEHLLFAKKFAERLSSTISPHTNEREPNRRLRIGYCSPDFRGHPVAYFIEPVLEAHNREHFEVFCYSLSPIQDEVTKRIQSYSDKWRSIVGMSDEDAATLICNDKIDILIDLAGHTGNNRILLFARKPAPIQVSWIGYLATTGLSTIDYKIADNYTDPPGKTEQFYTEKLIRLPESFLCYLPDKDSPEVGPLPALSTGHITFGSFNNFAKVTPEVFTLWARVLNELPDSRLILKAKSFADETTCQYAINMFTERGISAERIILQSWNPSPRHLESYNQVDIGLDTFPFNGATTTCEAMWMGVPVITLAGTAYHSRSGVSLLSNVGLPELIAETHDEYTGIAINLASDIEKLELLRKSLRDRMSHSPLTDAKRFTANLETCYRKMWEDWCNSAQA